MAVAVLLLPLVAVAVLPVLVATAVQLAQFLASAVLPAPVAVALECSPRAGLGVDADNPTGALGLYESLDFAVHSKWVTYRLLL